LPSPRNDFVQRILEKDTFQAISEVARRLLSRAGARFVDVALFAEDFNRQAVK
jgi:hypothetical protein